MVPTIIRLDILFEAISLVFSLSIASIAFLAWRKIDSKTLLLFSLGFFLMSVAMFTRVVLVGWVFTSSSPYQSTRIFPFLVLQIQEVVYSLLRLCSYLVFLYLYAAYHLKKESNLALIAPSLIYNPFFEAVSAMILAFVVYQLLNSSRHSTGGRLSYSASAFILLLISHLLFILTPFSLAFYLTAHLIQMVSLTLFLMAVSMVLTHGEGL